MKAYQKYSTYGKVGLRINKTVQGETIEQKIDRIMTAKQPIHDGAPAPLMYTDRSKGVLPETNIRTDRFAIAIDATTNIKKSYSARREERANAKKEDENPKIGGTEPIQGGGGGAPTNKAK